MRVYETTFILDPQKTEEEWNSSVEKYSGIITGAGGTVHRSNIWGQRRLAYAIRKQNRGYYVHLVHESPPEVPKTLSRQFALDEDCWRHLTVLGTIPPEEPAEPEATAEPAAAPAAPEAAPAAETAAAPVAATEPVAAEPPEPVGSEKPATESVEPATEGVEQASADDAEKPKPIE